MIKIDVSLVIQIVNFVFLIWILNRVLYKPIRQMLHQRKEKVAGLEKSIQTSIRDTNEKDESLVFGMKAAREKGSQERNALLSAAEEEEKKIIQAIHAKAQEELAAVRKKIAKDTEQVSASLHREIEGFARSISQKILGRPVE
jgi:F-type H+-transporting ATPase subunit b